MRAVLVTLALACTGFAEPVPPARHEWPPDRAPPATDDIAAPVNLSVRIGTVPPVVRSGREARIEVTPVNNGDAVRKHKLTGHVTVLQVTVLRAGSQTSDLRLTAGPVSGWTCAQARAGLTCYSDAPFERGSGPRIPLTALAAATGDYQVCATISAEGRTDRTPGDNRACANFQFLNTQTN